MAVRVRGSTSLIGVIWVIVGIFIAWTNDYITVKKGLKTKAQEMWRRCPDDFGSRRTRF